MLNNALEKVAPHLDGDIEIKTEIHSKEPRLKIITVQTWEEARMKACKVMVKLLDRKAKLMGLDKAQKTQPPPAPPPRFNALRQGYRCCHVVDFPPLCVRVPHNSAPTRG